MRGSIFLCFVLCALAVAAQKKPEVGIAQSLEQDTLLYARGYRNIVDNVQRLFSPITVSDEQFEKNLSLIKNSKLKLYAVNVFMPGEVKLVGPDVDEMKVMLYCERVFIRCQLAGVKMIVWGSGGARKIPDGFDREKAKQQFIVIAKKVAALAKAY